MDELRILEDDAARATKGLPLELLDGKTALITGASGVVGTHFLAMLAHCREHLGVRTRVIAVSLHDPPDHLRALGGNSSFEFVSSDLSLPENVASLPAADVIVHAATYGQPLLFATRQLETIKLNTQVTLGLLDRLLPDGRFLFLSSSEVYSGLAEPPFREEQIGTTSPSHPRACYIEAKRCGEAICHAATRAGITAKAVRLALGYGPGARRADQRVLYTLIERAIRDGKIVLKDAGLACRTYCYVSDAVHMMWRVLLEGSDVVYNVGGTSRITIRDLALLIGKATGVPVDIPEGGGVSVAGAPDDVWLDMSRFEKEFGAPTLVDLETGINRTIEWHAGLQDA